MRNGRCCGRPRLERKIGFKYKGSFLKPQGLPLKSLDITEINREELEALRLKDLEGLDQGRCAVKMNTSQSTFQRILTSARKKISEALINGKAIKVE